MNHEPRTTNRQPVQVAVGLGSNQGDRRRWIERGFQALAEVPETRLVSRSRVIETAPVGGPPQGDYLNAAALVETTLSPRQLLDAMLVIEHSCGRERRIRWGPRTLDLDLLFYGDRIVDEPGLRLPHPFMMDRLFVIEPLLDLAPTWRHPLTHEPLSSALDRARKASVENTSRLVGPGTSAQS